MEGAHDELVTILRAATSSLRRAALHSVEEEKDVLVAANLQRLRIGAWMLAVSTPAIVVVDLISLESRDAPISQPQWSELAIVRAILLIGAIAFLVASRRPGGRRALTRADHLLETGFAAFGLVYCALVAGLGQQVRPSIGAYLLGVFAVSAFVHLNGRKALIAYTPAWAVLVALLWSYQSDALRWPDIVNGTLMTLLGLVLSRVTYRGRLIELSNARLIESQRLELEKTNRRLTESNSLLRHLSYVDALTEVPNRRWLDEFLTREWARSIRERTPISLIMADLDHFKRLNDARGHQAGDSCLAQVAAAFRKAIMRPADFLARYGGEEFAVVLPDTDIDGARIVAERLQDAVDDLVIELPDGSTTSITVSIGIACLNPTRSCLPDDLIAAADRALYQAKAGGRAQCVCAS